MLTKNKYVPNRVKLKRQKKAILNRNLDGYEVRAGPTLNITSIKQVVILGIFDQMWLFQEYYILYIRACLAQGFKLRSETEIATVI